MSLKFRVRSHSFYVHTACQRSSGEHENSVYTKELNSLVMISMFMYIVYEEDHFCFSRTYDLISQSAVLVLWLMWWRNAGMATRPNALKWTRLSKCWKPLIQVKEVGWFLMTKSLGASVSARPAVRDSFILSSIEWCRNKAESKLGGFCLLLRICDVIIFPCSCWKLLSHIVTAVTKLSLPSGLVNEAFSSQ